MKRAAPLVLAALLAACGLRAEKLFTSYTHIEVREVARSFSCNSPVETPVAQVLPDLKAVKDWEAARGVTLPGSDALPPASYALVEMGLKPTGGYGLAIARAAVLRGELVILNATFVSPSPGSLRTQAISSPCVLVQLPPGRYSEIEVDDPEGAARVTGIVGPFVPPKQEPAS
jgi:hypothetical protein